MFLPADVPVTAITHAELWAHVPSLPLGGNLEVPAPFWGSPGAAALETALRGTSSSTTSASSSTNHSSSSGASSSSRSSNWPPPEERLARILKVNAFGDDYEDLAAAAARGVGGSSVVGLWPAFSYFNHSCLPSTVHYVVGDKMLVRAVQDIKKGEGGCGLLETCPVGCNSLASLTSFRVRHGWSDGWRSTLEGLAMKKELDGACSVYGSRL